MTDTSTSTRPQHGLRWESLPLPAQIYAATVIVAGSAVFAASFPLAFPRPLLFAFLLLTACLTSLWKVNLPIPVESTSTLSLSYAANLTALLLLGPLHAVLVAVAGVWTQCTFKVKGRYPRYRTVFSMAAEALTMGATGVAYAWLGGPEQPVEIAPIARPLVGAIATYFLVNTGLVAGAIALSTRQRVWTVWHEDFLWSGASFMVAGTAGAMAAVVIARNEHWKAVLMLAPVYLTYRTYLLFVGRLEDQRRHVAETTRLHQQAVEALELAESARASAERANQLKDQFLAMVSHELRTPLNAVLGWADLLRGGKLVGARRDRACHAIYNSARRQAALIDELLDVARMISGKLRVERSAVDLRAIIRSAAEMVQPAAGEKGIDIAVETDRSIGTISGDGPRLQQIVWNLLSNAVKFTQPGGAVRVRLRRVDGMAEIIVTDNGAGIAPDFLPAVFEPFRQADASTTRPHTGLGLGLAIVRHLAEAHGGTVRVYSDGEGRGATFTVQLPIVPVATGQVGAPAVEGEGPEFVPHAACLEGLTVLVVDDDYESREVVAAHLERHHAHVVTASSAAEALELLEHKRMHVLLADVAMPGEDGYMLIRKVRASKAPEAASIPALALTAFARDEDRQRALQAGFQLHMAKPVDAPALVAAIASLGRSTIGVTPEPL